MRFDNYDFFRRDLNRDFHLGFHALVPYENQAARLLNAFFEDDIYAFGRRPTSEETEEGYTITLELPGFKQTDLDLTIEKGELIIKAKRGEQTYDQSFIIPRDVDATATEAKLEDGILVVKLKKAESTKPRKVPVK